MKSKIISLSLLLLSFNNIFSWSFFVNSDLHCDGGVCKPGSASYAQKVERKLGQLEQMKNFINDKKNDVRATLLAGDLTNNGSQSEYNEYLKLWFNPLTKLKVKVLDGFGNHDTYSKQWWQIYSPTTWALCQRNGDSKYAYKIDNLYFLCCGDYPQPLYVFSTASLTWLRLTLWMLGPKTPVVIFFHYNILGQYSDWWSNYNKDLFFNAIKDYNVLAIFTGHMHAFTHSAMWRNKIKIASVAGDYFAKCDYDSKTKNLDINFCDKDGNIKTWTDLLRTDVYEGSGPEKTITDETQNDILKTQIDSMGNSIPDSFFDKDYFFGQQLILALKLNGRSYTNSILNKMDKKEKEFATELINSLKVKVYNKTVTKGSSNDTGFTETEFSLIDMDIEREEA